MSLTNNRLRRRLRSTRPAEAVDRLVWLLAGIMLCFWAVGSIYLYFFPLSGGIANASDATTDSAIVAGNDSQNAGTESGTTNDSPEDGHASMGQNGSGQNGSGQNGSGQNTSDGGADSKTGSAAANSFVGKPDHSGNRAANAMKPPVTSGQNSAPAVDANAIRKQVTASLTADHNRALQRLKTQHSNEKKSLLEKFTKDSGKNSAGFRQQVQDSQNKLTILQRKYDDLDKKYKSAQQTIAQNKRAVTTPANPVVSTPGTGQVIATNNTASQRPTPTKQTSRFTDYEFRYWKSNRGTDAWLAFVRWENGEIVLVDDQDELFKIPLNRLSDSDQRYVQQLK